MNYPSRLRWRRTPGSSWVEAVAYSTLAPEHRGQFPGISGFLHYRVHGEVYSCPVPSWIFGLICAAAKTGASVGRIVNRHVKARPSVAAGVAQ